MANNVRIFEMTKAISHPAVPHLGLRNVPFTAKQHVEATGTSSATPIEFNAATNAITIIPAVPIVVEFGTAPVADATSFPIAAEQQADFWVTPGTKLAIKTA
ncbi:hypothetical protein SZ64_04455 [Erythrobacter sp. SG61-1L]|uniref:hypothetical protein n=1 Tax=Erythrobacter sp. SG61-1L TaxID=1603897 RepID=UPI0006C8F420|nr:hypothetical protein [Erythrobacter sp. SG61-1L]KPL67420.1 hypothetical protein SZ64_04455 [Erythrobacter sp. SG61-1L]